MLVAVSFHAYFDVDVEESLSERKLYVYDKVSASVVNALVWIGFKESAAKNNELKMNDVDRHIAYQEVYKLLKRCVYSIAPDRKRITVDRHEVKSCGRILMIARSGAGTAMEEGGGLLPLRYNAGNRPF